MIKRRDRSRMGRIMENSIVLNGYKDVDVYLCIQGNTGCICLTVEENKTQAYQSRVFLTNSKGIKAMLKDVSKMRSEKEKQHAAKLLQ